MAYCTSDISEFISDSIRDKYICHVLGDDRKTVYEAILVSRQYVNSPNVTWMFDYATTNLVKYATVKRIYNEIQSYYADRRNGPAILDSDIEYFIMRADKCVTSLILVDGNNTRHSYLLYEVNISCVDFVTSSNFSIALIVTKEFMSGDNPPHFSDNCIIRKL
jgi:hypothetical protein